MPATRIIHLPLWIKEGRKEDSFTENPWESLQPLLEVVAAMFSVEAVVLDVFGICVAGTGPYKQGIGIKAPNDTTMAQSLTGRQTMVLNPREDAACLDCSQRDYCRDQANYTAPVEIDGAIIASVQIVAFDEEQRMALLERAEGTFLLITQCIRLLWRTKKLLPVFRDEITPDEQSLGAIVGNSPPMLYLKEIILKAARANGPVLISGESGTGKELVAAALHNNSPQHKNGPFVPVNCGALPEALMESELFGYAPGAFSGAQSGGKKGLWEQADGGTIFLDEVSELPLSLQVKLLRTLQDGQIRRVGGSKFTKVNVRVVAATNKDLREEVRLGRFRQDLFYRLNVIPVSVPPLRDRKEDIRALSTHFIIQQATCASSRMVVVDQQLMRRFMEYHWPGNVRELKNFIEYGIHFSKDSTITWDLLADHFETAPIAVATDSGGKLRKVRDGVSADTVYAAIRRHGQTVAGKKAAAKELGISLATLYRVLAQGKSDSKEI